MSDRIMSERKKAASPNFTNPSLVSPTSPTLAFPTRGFSSPQADILLKTQEIQASTQQPQQEETLKAPPLGHDISRILFRPQAKLSVSQPGDLYEQEADRVASQVMRMSTPEQFPVLSAPNFLQRKCAVCEEEEIQRKASDSSLQSNSDIESQLSITQGGGNPLSNEVRTFMEPRFGADFSSVRVHTDSVAVQLSRDLGAQAFTYGSNIYYGGGKSPGNNELTAHELTHVVQQSTAPEIQRKKVCDENGACYEELDPVVIEGDPNAPIELDPVVIGSDEESSSPVTLDPVVIEGDPNAPIELDPVVIDNVPGTDYNSCVEEIDEDVAGCADKVNTACSIYGASIAGTGAAAGALIGSLGLNPVTAGIGGLIGGVAGTVYGAYEYGECVEKQNKGCRDAGKAQKKKCATKFQTTP